MPVGCGISKKLGFDFVCTGGDGMPWFKKLFLQLLPLQIGISLREWFAVIF